MQDKKIKEYIYGIYLELESGEHERESFLTMAAAMKIDNREVSKFCFYNNNLCGVLTLNLIVGIGVIYLYYIYIYIYIYKGNYFWLDFSFKKFLQSSIQIIHVTNK